MANDRFTEKTVGNEVFLLPRSGTPAPWGEELHDLLNAMIDSLNIVQGPQDIQETSSNILNTLGEKEITGLSFNTSLVRSAEISYNITRDIDKAISAIPTGTGVIQIDCSTKHNLFTGDLVTISGSNSTPSIDGTYTITKVNDNSFTIDISSTIVTVAGTSGEFTVQLIESGTLLVNYGSQGWKLTRFGQGDALVDIDFSPTGGGRYTPEVLEGVNHEGIIKFIAKALITT